ncbi:MAG: DUF4215 domain-containing protein [Polyangiales bacterium]
MSQSKLAWVVLWLAAISCGTEQRPLSADGHSVALNNSAGAGASSSPTDAGCDQEDAGDDDAGASVPSSCGNGVIEGAELCDDGNLVDADGCSARCEPDDIALTPGDDRAGYFECSNGNVCGPDSQCCLGLPECLSKVDYPVCPSRPTDDCDGPEDCGSDELCWLARFGRFCGPTSGGGYYVVCHSDDDCASAPCFQGQPGEVCPICFAGLCGNAS